MDIFENQDDRIMNPDELLFTRLINSTNSVESHFSEIDMDEEDFIHVLYATEDIVAIDCNFGHIRWDNYDPSPPKKKTNKGRKPQEKPKSKRKLQGDGTCFNSNIQFTIRGSCIREISDVPDTKVVEEYINREILDDGLEEITKYYKIKLYRNGTVSLPGSLKEDLSDCDGPLNLLEAYLRDVTNLPVERTYTEATMRNYKFRLHNHRIDLRALQSHFLAQHERVKLVRFEDIKKFLITPIFADSDCSPMDDGWDAFIRSQASNTGKGRELDFVAMERFLKESTNSKDMFVLIDDLKNEINNYNPIKLYDIMRYIVQLVEKRHGYKLGNIIISKALEIHMEKYFALLQRKLSNSKNNEISGIRYNPERFQGFVIRIKPMEKTSGNGSNRNITIKLFAGGKINIDNAKSPEEANYIYFWLNNLFLENPELIYDPDIHMDDLDPDDEWSYTSSDDDESDTSES